MSFGPRDVIHEIKWQAFVIQRRVNSAVDHLHPYRWNWALVVRPLDAGLARQTDRAVPQRQLRSLRFFWLDGLFSAISENLYLSFIPLLALAYGATNGDVGWLAAVANLLGALALFPGAQLVERVGRRQPIVVWSGGGGARLALLLLALLPLVAGEARWAIVVIIILNGLRAFLSNLANPAWTALVADLVPDFLRGRYFGSRNMAMGIAALLAAPFAGRLIAANNGRFDLPFFGYQIVFFLAFAFGLLSLLSFKRIEEPPASAASVSAHHRGDLRRALRRHPAFVGLVISGFVWNLALHTAAPFFNVYLVNQFQASTATIGALASVSSLTALFGQRLFGRLLDERGAIWVQTVCSFIIPLLPLGWVFITAPWQVGLINTLGGFVWAGYNLANFSLLLALTPDEQRPRAVALYQTAVFGSAVLGPIIGGYLADAVSYRLLFGLSSGGRLLGAGLFLALTARVVRRSHDSHGVAEGLRR